VRSDPSGNVILAGEVNGTIDFGDGSLTVHGGDGDPGGFIAKLAPNGAYLSGSGTT